MLKTERLTLRPLAAEDADWITQGVSNPEVTKWLTAPPWPYARPNAVDFLNMTAGAAYYWAIEAEARPIGVVTLRDIGNPALGFWLGPMAWGKGYMTEALCGVLDYHFAQSDLSVESGWIMGNAKSESVHRKVGFVDLENKEVHSNYHGRPMPQQRVILTAQAYTTARDTLETHAQRG